MSEKNGQLREFGRFRLDAEKKVLWFEGEPVNLQLKEIELLCVLTERGGEVLTKDEILNRVWADSFVEESNLPQHIYRLRKIFRESGEPEDLIQTVPRRGYRFAGEIRTNGGDELIIERHSISRTLIEEVEASAAPDLKAFPVKTRRFLFPVIIGLMVLTTAFGIYFYNRGAAANQPIRSIAVLPLKSLDNEGDKALNLGFADTLITNLGKLNEIRVLSTNSVKDYADKPQEPQEIGVDLGVDAIVEGTLQRAGGKLRVTLRLIRTSDGRQIWSESFDEAESEIFRLQDAIAVRTAKALSLNLNLNNRDAVLRHYTENTDAYQAYQSGRYLHFQNEYEKAIREFERALQFDSKYVLAYAGLADSYAFLANNTEGIEGAKLYEKAKSHALHALALDENLAEAHAALGWIRRIYDWDWAEAEKHLRRAVELDPNSSVAHQRLAYLYITLGRTEEAVRVSQQAKLLNPVNHSVGWAFYTNRQYEEAAAEYARRLSLANSVEKQREPRLGLAISCVELGRYEEAIRIIEESPPESKNDFAVRTALAIALYRAGKGERASKVLRLLEEKANEKNGRWARLAYVYAAMGRKNEAVDALKKGLETRDDRLMWIKTTPYFDSLRDEPRFQEVLRKMDLN